jgi:hypothetical protein
VFLFSFWMNKIFIPTQRITKIHSSKKETKLDHCCLATNKQKKKNTPTIYPLTITELTPLYKTKQQNKGKHSRTLPGKKKIQQPLTIRSQQTQRNTPILAQLGKFLLSSLFFFFKSLLPNLLLWNIDVISNIALIFGQALMLFVFLVIFS